MLTWIGKGERRRDLFLPYALSGGGMAKVRECVAGCREEDFDRWNEDIIEPLIRSD